ncbi:MAG: hypothetical protein GWP42_13385 [Verrucomicrobiales bacterium]|nr:hypothetical protein [Verrucomicrobiales bacterium]
MHKKIPPKATNVSPWRARVKRSSFSGSVILRGLPKVMKSAKRYQQNLINAIIIHERTY